MKRRACLALPTLLASAIAPSRASAPPATLLGITENLPPLNYEDELGPQGFSVELLRLMADQAGLGLELRVLPWARAMQMAESNAHSVLFSLTRTPEREAQFQWLLKLYVQHFVFINRSGQPAVASVAQARRLRLTVLRGSPNLAQLQRHGFDTERVVQASSVEDMLRLLEKGFVDAIYGGDIVNMDKVRGSGRDPAAFQIGLPLESGEIWLAASGGFGDADRQLLKDAHQALLREGGVERLFRGYGIRPRAEDLR